MRSRLGSMTIGLVGLTAIAAGCGGGTSVDPEPLWVGAWDWDMSVIAPTARQLLYHAKTPTKWAAADLSMDQKVWCRLYMTWTLPNPESNEKFTWAYTISADACGEKKGSTGTVAIEVTGSNPTKIKALKTGTQAAMIGTKCGDDPLVDKVCDKSSGLGKPAAP